MQNIILERTRVAKEIKGNLTLKTEKLKKGTFLK